MTEAQLKRTAGCQSNTISTGEKRVQNISPKDGRTLKLECFAKPTADLSSLLATRP